MKSLALAWKQTGAHEWTSWTVYGKAVITRSSAPWWVKLRDWRVNGYRAYFRGKCIGWHVTRDGAAQVATSVLLDAAKRNSLIRSTRK